MAPLNDPTLLGAYKDALGNWRFEGFIQFELNETAFRWVKRELDGMTLKEIGRRMHEYVESGGVIDQVRERRPEWQDHEFHYDLRFTIADKPVYIETRLNPPFAPDETTITVVNIHAP